MTSSRKLFWILWAEALAGVFSLTLIDLNALVANLPVAAGTPLPMSPLAIKLVSVIQPSIILLLAIIVGKALAPRLGLSSPAAEAVARGESFFPALRPQILPGIAGGVIGGIGILGSWVLWRPFLSPVFVARAEALNKIMPIPTRLLHGGFTEELLLRWGVMTLLVWAQWKFLQRGEGKPRPAYFVSAILISSVIFGAGHLGIIPVLAVDLTPAIFSYIVAANSLFGLIAGYLFWKKGLESAMIAHIFTHVLIVMGLLFGK